MQHVSEAVSALLQADVSESGAETEAGLPARPLHRKAPLLLAQLEASQLVPLALPTAGATTQPAQTQRLPTSAAHPDPTCLVTIVVNPPSATIWQRVCCTGVCTCIIAAYYAAAAFTSLQFVCELQTCCCHCGDTHTHTLHPHWPPVLLSSLTLWSWRRRQYLHKHLASKCTINHVDVKWHCCHWPLALRPTPQSFAASGATVTRPCP